MAFVFALDQRPWTKAVSGPAFRGPCGDNILDTAKWTSRRWSWTRGEKTNLSICQGSARPRRNAPRTLLRSVGKFRCHAGDDMAASHLWALLCTQHGTIGSKQRAHSTETETSVGCLRRSSGPVGRTRLGAARAQHGDSSTGSGTFYSIFWCERTQWLESRRHKSDNDRNKSGKTDSRKHDGVTTAVTSFVVFSPSSRALGVYLFAYRPVSLPLCRVFLCVFVIV